MALDHRGTATAEPDPLPRMSYEEFLDWCDEEVHAEWVDGEVEIMSPVSRDHQLVRDFALTALRLYVDVMRAGEVLSEPYQMRLRRQNRGRSPDLLFVRTENLGRVGDKYLDGPADLVIEVISPDSRRRDREVKYAEYQAAGVPEYWIIDPLKRTLDLFQLGPDGRYAAAAPDAEGRYASAVLPGFWLLERWLWARPMPDLLQVARAWGLL